MRDLALKVAKVVQPGEGVGVRLRLELARRLRTSSSVTAAWIAPGGVHQVLVGVGEQLPLALGELVPQRRHQHGLQRSQARATSATEASWPPLKSREGRPRSIWSSAELVRVGLDPVLATERGCR